MQHSRSRRGNSFQERDSETITMKTRTADMAAVRSTRTRGITATKMITTIIRKAVTTAATDKTKTTIATRMKIDTRGVTTTTKTVKEVIATATTTVGITGITTSTMEGTTAKGSRTRVRISTAVDMAVADIIATTMDKRATIVHPDTVAEIIRIMIVSGGMARTRIVAGDSHRWTASR
jgi:hypothetical protein